SSAQTWLPSQNPAPVQLRLSPGSQMPGPPPLPPELVVSLPLLSLSLPPLLLLPPLPPLLSLPPALWLPPLLSLPPALVVSASEPPSPSPPPPPQFTVSAQLTSTPYPRKLLPITICTSS